MTISTQTFRIILSITLVLGQLPAIFCFVKHSGSSSFTVSSTVIVGSVLRCQVAQLHVDCVGGCVCSQSGLALELLSIFFISILRVNPSNPLHALFRHLPHRVHILVNKGVTRSLAGQLH